jgi:hypothetical protein
MSGAGFRTCNSWVVRGRRAAAKFLDGMSGQMFSEI